MIEAVEGDYLMPDDWASGETVMKGKDYLDSSFIGSEFCIYSKTDGYYLPINITITGRKNLFNKNYSKNGKKYRCKIEFVKDGEASIFQSGYIVASW